MNWWYITVSALLAAGFAVHITAGNRAWSLLDPARTSADDPLLPVLGSIWLMGRGGYQMIGADLLVPCVYFALVGGGVFPDSFAASLVFAVLYGLYCIGWLLGLAFSRAPAREYVIDIQWALFLAVSVLIVLGISR